MHKNWMKIVGLWSIAMITLSLFAACSDDDKEEKKSEVEIAKQDMVGKYSGTIAWSYGQSTSTQPVRDCEVDRNAKLTFNAFNTASLAVPLSHDELFEALGNAAASKLEILGGASEGEMKDGTLCFTSFHELKFPLRYKGKDVMVEATFPGTVQKTDFYNPKTKELQLSFSISGLIIKESPNSRTIYPKPIIYQLNLTKKTSAN